MNNQTLDSLASIQGVNALLRRLGAEQLLRLLERTGFWLNVDSEQRRPHTFPAHNLGRINDQTLGDQCGYWQSELSRAYSVLGALEGALIALKHEMNRARDAAEVREWDAAAAAGAKRTGAEVSARARADKAYLDHEDRVRQAEVIIAAMRQNVAALEGYTKVLSRELTRRGDQVRGRIR